ncbi:MAG: hypothetical protein F6K35_42845 [Okeania sp. SIO2H7]|nr:hypothetical protein [Okeania sp. SIO2H7]
MSNELSLVIHCTLYALIVPPPVGGFQSKDIQPGPWATIFNARACPGELWGVGRA